MYTPFESCRVIFPAACGVSTENKLFPLPPLDAGIKSIVPGEMFSAVRNVRCQFSKKDEGIENFEVPLDAFDDLFGAVDDGLLSGKILHLPDGKRSAVRMRPSSRSIFRTRCLKSCSILERLIRGMT